MKKEKVKEIEPLGEIKETEEKAPFSSLNLLDIKKDLTITKDFKNGVFVIELPNPRKKQDIARRIGYHFNCPLENIPANDIFTARVLITLDMILKKWPDWWKGSTECYDQALIFDLYNWYIDEENNLNEKLKKNKLGFICK